MTFELGSQSPVMIKRESGSRERVGEGYYEQIDFSQVNSDDYIPDEDPLSLDQVSRHCHVVDRRKAKGKTKSCAISSPSEPARDSILLTNPLGNGIVEEIGAIIHENESELEESDVKVKMEFVGSPADISKREYVTDSAGCHGGIIGTIRKEKQRTWLCTLCNVGFPNEQLYIFHVKVKHADKFPHSCRHCGKRFAKLIEKKKHETILDPNRFKGEPKFSCEFCDKKYHIKVSLEGHRKIAHLGYIKPKKRIRGIPIKQHHSRGIRRPEPEVKVEKVLYPCTECDLKFDFKFKLTRHMRCHTGETPFSCEICHQPFKSASSWRGHIKTIHKNPSNGPRCSRPKFMWNQPCPCNICGRVFKIPSLLEKHMTIHTGEKKYECDICGKRFRMAQGLKYHLVRHERKENNQRRFKCRYCGRRFLGFSELNNHRLGRHRNIPIPENRDVEKCFGCGICGKPFYTQEQAMVCAILAHDPETLRKAMFKHKCSECPAEKFGYHNLVTLRKHWQNEHPHKTLPVEFRKGMYQDLSDNLPNVVIDKDKAKEIKENGTSVKYDYPLFVEFELLGVEEPGVRKTKKQMPVCTKRNTECTVCGLVLLSYNLKRHMHVHQKQLNLVDAERKEQLSTSKSQHGGMSFQQTLDPNSCECTICGLVLLRHSLKRHMRLVHTNPKNQKNGLSTLVCGICSQRFRKMKTLRQHEKIYHKSRTLGPSKRTIKLAIDKDTDSHTRRFSISNQPSEGIVTPDFDRLEYSETVNVNDAASVEALLGGKTVKIILSRVMFDKESCHAEANLVAKSEVDCVEANKPKTINIHDAASINSILGNKELQIFL